MDEAIDAVLRGEKLYPNRSSFIAADLSRASRSIEDSRRRGYTAVVVFSDGGTHLIAPTLRGRIRALLRRDLHIG
jgi:hypothetical protein